MSSMSRPTARWSVRNASEALTVPEPSTSQTHVAHVVRPTAERITDSASTADGVSPWLAGNPHEETHVSPLQ